MSGWSNWRPLRILDLVAQTVNSALRLREQPGRPLQDTLADYLRDKQLLLILDNCEHLIEASARLSDALLHAAPELRILASSREGLGIAGEATYHVPSLPVPNLKGDISSANLETFDAVRLFVERASAAKSAFALATANASAIAQICYRLDGIPLAIELAAAHVKSLPVETIAARLDDRFRLLTGGSRTALPRQQTLRGTIDWSYSLLTDAERVLLRRLSVFVGGCTLEAAEAVCAGEGIESFEVLDLLTRLVDKSLMMVDEHSAETRYCMLETIRQYSRDKLLDSGEGDSTRDRHLSFFMQFATDSEAKIMSTDQKRWLERCDAELDNLRAAFDWSSDTGDAFARLHLPAALLFFWSMRGYLSESIEALRVAVETTAKFELTPSLAQAQIKSLMAFSMMLTASDKNSQARHPAEEAVGLAERFADSVGHAKASLVLAMAELY